MDYHMKIALLDIIKKNAKITGNYCKRKKKKDNNDNNANDVLDTDVNGDGLYNERLHVCEDRNLEYRDNEDNFRWCGWEGKCYCILLI